MIPVHSFFQLPIFMLSLLRLRYTMTFIFPSSEFFLILNLDLQCIWMSHNYKFQLIDTKEMTNHDNTCITSGES